MPQSSFRFPTNTQNNSGVTNPGNMFASDDARAVFDNLNDTVELINFGDFGIPDGSVITGIEVVVECHYTGSGLNRTLNVSIHDGSAWRSKTASVSSQNTDAEQTFGGSSDVWGGSWVVSDFANGTFKARISLNDFSVTNIQIDSIKVKVYYSSTFDALHDDFNDNSIDTAVWTVNESGAGDVSETNGRIEITTDGNAETDQYIETVETYDLTGSRVWVQYGQPSDSVDPDFSPTILDLRLDSTHRVFWHISDGSTLRAGKYDGGYTQIWSTTMDSDVYKYFRIREAGGTIYYDTSTDGITWTNRGSTTVGFAITALKCRLTNYRAGSPDNTVWWDNLNVASMEKTVQARGRIRSTGKTKTVQARASILRTLSKTVTARARISDPNEPNYVERDNTAYNNWSEQALRNVKGRVEVDWDVDGDFTDESPRLMSLEVERQVNEPLGGVSLAQFDVRLYNEDNRYTPGNESSDIEEYLIKERRSKFYVGYDNFYMIVGKGISELPRVNVANYNVDIHYFDELERISNFKLSDGGELFTNIRVDRYVWRLLDEVYADDFAVINACDNADTWTNGVTEDVNHRSGDACKKITSTSGAEEVAYHTYGSPQDFSDYTDEDYFAMFIYCEDATKIENLIVRLYTVDTESWFEYDIGANVALKTGWNEIWVSKGDFISNIDVSGSVFTIGTSEIEGADEIGASAADWSNINKLEVILDATDSDTTSILIDAMRFCDSILYPRRYFDIGLQTIPVAYFGGNTALYEIKTACESEGARLYADEDGALHFENRQHYNNNIEKKTTKFSFRFNRLTDFFHPQDEQDIINKVVVTLRPRVIVAEEVIFTYGLTPSIGAGETKTIWASLLDPCPTTSTGIVEPVATTDYTGNDQEDGGGSDRTSDISITTTKFTNAVRLDIKNTGGTALYLTKLQVRGTPAKESDPIRITREDATSIATYGEQPSGGYKIENKYMADEDFAVTLADQVIDWYRDHRERVTIKGNARPEVQLGDMISIKNEYVNKEYLMRVMGIKLRFSPEEGLRQEIRARVVDPFETLTFFEIGTSSIESTDVIAA